MRVFLSFFALIAGLLVSKAAFAAPEPVQKYAIKCNLARSPMERLICSDPKLIEYDGRIAAAYERALGEWGGVIATYVRADQRDWLTRRTEIEKPSGDIDPDCAISDKACVRGFMLKRVNDLESGAYRSSGIYREPGGMKLLLYPGLANAYSLRIYDPANFDRSSALLDDGGKTRAALWNGPDTLVATMGDNSGVGFPEGTCSLNIAVRPLTLTVKQNGACGGKNYTGTFTRDLTDILAEYEVDLH